MAVYAGYKTGDKDPDKPVYGSCNLTQEIWEDWWKNAIDLLKEYTINVPPFESKVVNYRASLAHKINHDFHPNAKYHECNHPR